MAVRRPAGTVAPEGAHERLLVEAAQKGPAKFGDLYELHFDRIYAFVARRVRDRDIAADLTSEVFHKALANLRNYEWRGAPFAAWLIRIAAHAVADQSTRAAREVPSSEDPPDDPQPSKIGPACFAWWTSFPATSDMSSSSASSSKGASVKSRCSSEGPKGL